MRVLFVTGLPWVKTLGAPRQQVELSEALAGLGVDVDHIDAERMGYRKPKSRIGRVLHDPPPARRAVRATRRVARGFDLVEGHQSMLPVSASTLGAGALVVRSSGLVPIYDRYRRETRPNATSASHELTAVTRAFQRRRGMAAALGSYRAADLAIALNDDELRLLREVRGGSAGVAQLPIGLPDAHLTSIGRAALPDVERLGERRVAFVGSWSHRKGADDWPVVVRETWAIDPDIRFRFLGTGLSDAALAAALQLGDRLDPRVEHHARFSPDELGDLLAACTLAALPSYVEGYVTSAVEAAAAGLGTVAYDATGAREIPSRLPGRWLVPRGDARELARLIAANLDLNAQEYEALSAACRSIAHEHSWDVLAPITLGLYEQALAGRA